MRLILNFILLCWLGLTQAAPVIEPRDSVGIIKVKDQTFVRHKVTKGETFSSLSRRYGCSVEDIKKSNNNLKQLNLGQTIRIPAPVKNAQTSSIKTDSVIITIDESHANADSRESTTGKKHIVQAGDNLNKIATKYKVSTAQIVKWNGLSGSSIKIGQELVVSGSQTIKPYEKWNQVNSLTAKTVPPVKSLSQSSNLIEESGWILETSNCTHPLLPVGSVIICFNPDTQQQILVVVSEQSALPNGCVIGLNKHTIEKLGMSSGSNRIIIQYNQP